MELKNKKHIGGRFKKIRFVLAILAVVALNACGSSDGENPVEPPENENAKQGNQGENHKGNEEGEQMSDDDPLMEEARFEPKKLAGLMEQGAYQQIYSQTSELFQAQVGWESFEQISESTMSVVTGFELVSEFQLNGALQLSWKDEGEQFGMQAVFDDQNTIHSLLIQPLEAHPDTDEKFTETEFLLPFKDEWFVFWGGTNVMVNYHYAHPSQRYAYDFVRVQDGFSYDGNPEKNESYYAFGAEVVAPAAGKVVKVMDGIEDNEPVGQMNPAVPTGNYVVIDHGNGEFSHLAHFQNGTITVREGDRLEAGDLLGMCGNSGNSSEAHIHFQVSDGPVLEESTSLRIRFKEDAGLRPEGYVQGELVTS